MSILKDLRKIPRTEKIKTLQERIDLLEDGKEYTILSKMYTNSKEKLLFLHTKCGETFEMTADRFAWNNRCPSCSIKTRAEKSRSPKSEIHSRLLALLGDEYTLNDFEEVYETVHSSLNVTHLKCKNTYQVLARHILYDNNRCTVCSNMMLHDKSNGQLISRGELFVIGILEDLGVEFHHNAAAYEIGKSFSFDFKIPLTNGGFAVIEYDGEQHSDPRKFNGNDNFRTDRIKDKYCEENSIPLLRIPYSIHNRNVRELIEDFLF